MSEQTPNTPHAIAEMLQITPVTLRRWCEYHAAYLSAWANPGQGQARRFTGKDLQVLQYVSSLRAQGKTTANINEQLAGLTFAEIDEMPSEQTDGLHLPDQATSTRQLDITAVDVTPITASPQAQIEQMVQSAMSAEINRLETQITDIKRDSRGVAYGIGLGFVLALLFLLLIVCLAILYGR